MADPTETRTFFKSPFSRQAASNRRQSTRVEYSVPLVISGRDAKGESFREESQTKIVNLHGAKLKTTRQILVGMQVCIENPQNAATEKGVCVKIEEDVPGENAHYIAVQLIRPGNIWGLANPPEDWTLEAANMPGRTAPAPRAAVPEPARTLPSESTAPIVESQAVTWEQQSADLVESVLQIFRQQIETLSKTALQEFENRLAVLEKEAGERIEQRAGKTLGEVSALVDGMQESVASEIAAQGTRVMDEAEQELRAKVAEILAPLMGVSANVVPAKPVGASPRK